MSKHTAGPWKVRGCGVNRIWATVEGPNGEEIIWQSGPYQTLAIFVSDARLIAAAPEMLELLAEIRDQHLIPRCGMDDCTDCDDKIFAARIDALIDKIERGEE